jgi:uncharacterized RDD family membrane protein YckC
MVVNDVRMVQNETRFSLRVKLGAIREVVKFPVASLAWLGIQGKEEIEIMPWYYANYNQRLGPVNDAEFARLAREKIIQPDTLVWQHGMPDWKSYSEVVTILTPPEIPFGGNATGALPKEVEPSFTVPDAAMILAGHPAGLNYASFGLRAGAAVLDWLVVMGLGRILAQICGVANIDLIPLASGDLTKLVPLLEQLSMYMLADGIMRVAYYWFFMRKYEATPGKMVFGLKVVRSDGSALSHGQIIGRFFAEIVSKYFTFGFGYLMAAFDRENRAMHDQMCDTRVVKKTRT